MDRMHEYFEFLFIYVYIFFYRMNRVPSTQLFTLSQPSCSSGGFWSTSSSRRTMISRTCSSFQTNLLLISWNEWSSIVYVCLRNNLECFGTLVCICCIVNSLVPGTLYSSSLLNRDMLVCLWCNFMLWI
jgi:hypothetical protein